MRSSSDAAPGFRRSSFMAACTDSHATVRSVLRALRMTTACTPTATRNVGTGSSSGLENHVGKSDTTSNGTQLV